MCSRRRGSRSFTPHICSYPFGTPIADHPHTALPAMVAATLLKAESPAAAQDLLLLAYVFANMLSAYALCWDITRHRRGAVLGALIFGLSPYLASHLLGHFDLVAAWVLPLFALTLRRAAQPGARSWAVVAGLGSSRPPRTWRTTTSSICCSSWRVT